MLGRDIAYELSKDPDVMVVNDGLLSEKYDRDVEYWDGYYHAGSADTTASLFAQHVLKEYLQENKEGRILELGCGNGRDSRYFLSNGFRVVAIDASKKAIEILQKEFSKTRHSIFICGDFVDPANLCMEEYDFCYSRFSIHSINEKQEKALIKNVYGALKKRGYFFIEARSVFDELYGKGEKVGEDAYFFNGHYRRFIRKEKLQSELKKNGFDIASLEENRGFAPYREENPIIIRCIARKGMTV